MRWKKNMSAKDVDFFCLKKNILEINVKLLINFRMKKKLIRVCKLKDWITLVLLDGTYIVECHHLCGYLALKYDAIVYNFETSLRHASRTNISILDFAQARQMDKLAMTKPHSIKKVKP